MKRIGKSGPLSNAHFAPRSLSANSSIFEITGFPLKALGNTSLRKKCFLSGIARMRGGDDPAQIKKIHYIYLFLAAEKDVQVAQIGGRGERYFGQCPKENILFSGGVP